MSRLPYSLPLAGYAIADVGGDFHFELVIDDVPKSRLVLEGPFRLGTADDPSDLFEAPYPAWARDVLLSLVGVLITAARYNRRSSLTISFADGRTLSVGDGPFENWHYFNDDGVRLHGGAGQVS